MLPNNSVMNLLKLLYILIAPRIKVKCQRKAQRNLHCLVNSHINLKIKHFIKIIKH